MCCVDMVKAFRTVSSHEKKFIRNNGSSSNEPVQRSKEE